MDFYLELSSESSLFANNLTTSFRTLINPTKPLKGEWEVALTEIYLPRFRNKGTEGIHTVVDGTKTNFTITLEHYDDAEQLLDGIRGLRIPGVTLRYNKVNGRVYYEVQSGVKAVFSLKLAEILGFEPEKEYTGRGYANDRVDMERGIKPILFQTGLITPQVFRESRRPILRSLYQQGHFELTPKYCRVVDRDLEELSFNITTVEGKPVYFLPGSVDFTLHFRPVNSEQ